MQEHVDVTNLLEGLRIYQDPTNLDDLSAIFRNINAVFVTSGSDMDDNETIRCRHSRW